MLEGDGVLILLSLEDGDVGDVVVDEVSDVFHCG